MHWLKRNRAPAMPPDRKQSMGSVSSLPMAPPKVGRQPNQQVAAIARPSLGRPTGTHTEVTPKPRAAPPKRAWPMSPVARPARGGFAEAQSPPRRRPRSATPTFEELVGRGPGQATAKNQNEKMKFFEAAINHGAQQRIQLDSFGPLGPGSDPCVFGSMTGPGGSKSFLKIPVSAIELVTSHSL